MGSMDWLTNRRWLQHCYQSWTYSILFKTSLTVICNVESYHRLFVIIDENFLSRHEYNSEYPFRYQGSVGRDVQVLDSRTLFTTGSRTLTSCGGLPISSKSWLIINKDQRLDFWYMQRCELQDATDWSHISAGWFKTCIETYTELYTCITW